MNRKSLMSSYKVLAAVALLCFTLFPAHTAAWAAEPVRVGLLVSLSGVYTALGIDIRDGFTMYMDEIGNKAGGREIETVVQDIDSNRVSMALDGARKLVEKEHVSILAGVIGSGSAYALSQFVEKHKIPFVISNAGADDLTQRKANPYIVRPSKANSSSSHPLGEWLYEKGHRRGVLMGADYAAG